MPNNLIVNQKSVRDLFQDNKTDFLIPDYQRPYAWGKENVERCGRTYSSLPSLMQMLPSLMTTRKNTGDKQKSRYAENFRFFQQKIQEFLFKFPVFFAYLPIRILNNCILLPIEAESQMSFGDGRECGSRLTMLRIIDCHRVCNVTTNHSADG